MKLKYTIAALAVTTAAANAALILEDGYNRAVNSATPSWQSFTVDGSGDYYVQGIRTQVSTSGTPTAKYMKLVSGYGTASQQILSVSTNQQDGYLGATTTWVNDKNLVHNFNSTKLSRGTQYHMVHATGNSMTNLEQGSQRMRLDTGNPYAGGRTSSNADWDAEFQIQHSATEWTGQVAIANNGFEANAITAGSTANQTNTTPDSWTWNSVGNRGLYRNNEPTIGLHSGGLANGAQLSQTLGATVAADTVYLLSAYAHFGTSGTTEASWSIGLYSEGFLLGELDSDTFNDSFVPNNEGKIDDVTHVGSPRMSVEIDPFAIGGVNAGDNLEIRIIQESGAWIHPDEINLYTATIPEPSSTALLGLGGLALLLRRRK